MYKYCFRRMRIKSMKHILNSLTCMSVSNNILNGKDSILTLRRKKLLISTEIEMDKQSKPFNTNFKETSLKAHSNHLTSMD